MTAVVYDLSVHFLARRADAAIRLAPNHAALLFACPLCRALKGERCEGDVKPHADRISVSSAAIVEWFAFRFPEGDLSRPSSVALSDIHGLALARAVNAELPVLEDDASNGDVYAASRVSAAFEPEKLEVFSKVKRWTK